MSRFCLTSGWSPLPSHVSPMLDPNDRSHLMEPTSLAAAVDFSEIDGLLGDRARLIEHPQLGRTLEALCHTVLTRVSRGLLLCVRATRTNLLRPVCTGGCTCAVRVPASGVPTYRAPCGAP